MKELPYFSIDGQYGSNQDWFTDFWMNKGGCGAVTACDACLCLALSRNMRQLSPVDPETVTKEAFLAFAGVMRPYLSPRPSGINRTKLFIDGFSAYLDERCPGASLSLSSLEGTETWEAAGAAIRAQIDAGLPVPYLMLLHTDKALEDFYWHWFVLNGYDDADGRFMVRAFTYGETGWFDLRHLWDTGHEEKGGFVLLGI